MTNPEYDPRVKAVAKAIYAISPRFEWTGSDMTTYSPIAWERLDSIDSDEFLDFARAAIAALDIPALERAAYDRGYSAAETDMTHGGLYASYGRETDE